MKNNLRVLLLSVLFVFSLSSIAFAEEYSVKNNGLPFSYYAPSGKTICSYGVAGTDNYVDDSIVIARLSDGNPINSYYVKKGSHFKVSTVNSSSDIDEIVFKIGVSSPPFNSESNVVLTSVGFCDGTSINFDNPLAPPPEEGGGGDTNNPPAGGNLPPGTDWGAVDTSKPANACGGGRWTSPIRNWVDNIFCPVITFLDLARSKLAAVSLMMGQGLNIGKYFKIFGDLPLSWQLVVSSLLLMVATLGGLLIFRSAMRIYYSIKEGVKWW